MIKVLRIDKNIKKTANIVSNLIKQGKVLICPTDTVYGLIADATNRKAVNKIFQIKKRQRNKPLPIFIRNIETAKKLTYINKKQGKFLKKIWPGKVTVVLKRKRGLKLYGVAKNTIALRVPKYPLLLKIMERTNLPLTGTSANISGEPPSHKIKKVLEQFKNQKITPDLVISAGNLKRSEPSSIIDLTRKRPKILRRGDKIPQLKLI